MAFRQIKETCLYVRDLESTKAFYHGKLGLPLIGEMPGRHVFFRAGSSVLLCFIAAVSRAGGHLPAHFGSGQLHLAFEVDPADYAERKAALEAQDIAIEQEYDWGRGFKSFYFRDPDGHLLEVVPAGLWER